MKIYSIILLLWGATLTAQVGIGTTNPTATLDVDGNLRLRGTNEETDLEIIQDSILVISRNGTVNRVSSKNIIESHLKSIVKGNMVNNGTISLSLLSGKKEIVFDQEEIDLHNEYDTSTGIFTAKQDGIYRVSVNLYAGGISVSSNFGVGIYKNGALVAKNSFANIGVAFVNVTPPARAVSTIVQLNTNETLSFKVLASLLSVGISGDNTETFFTIEQIR
ncbi:C1q-like domain-containing protein [Cochleicola gelatinilyticus]|uniref:C1q domain-containing protein n=1 Tax=Cochleicola gelatinilyticus TaxID=1763537 RepID=A0A167EMG9_9FLAO|nr:hypothetical protein [Cochleicola gelatinilyticus]OAB75683.1 hypothetical protein ULVI_14490 [Cochleicola gelatinilyticus]